MKYQFSKVIQTYKKLKKYVRIYGQAPSDYPELATFLVEQGIDSILLNANSVIKVRELLSKKEQL